MFNCFVLSFILFGAAQSKEIALTFDDSPRFAVGYLDGPTRAQKLIQGLKEAGVPQVAFFSVANHVDAEGQQRLESYASAGHLIANHSQAHADYNQTSSSNYIRDFGSAHQKLAQFKNFRRWYRFPYLREGDTQQKRDAMRTALSKEGYLNAYITVNNYDWYMENQFQKAIKANKDFDFARFKSYYVGVLMDTVEYYDQMAIRHLGRSPRHVLLLHETDTNALFIKDLIAALRAKGWKIISPERAYQDPLVTVLSDKVFKFNPGRVGEVAASKGQKEGLWHASCDESYLDREFAKLGFKMD